MDGALTTRNFSNVAQKTREPLHPTIMPLILHLLPRHLGRVQRYYSVYINDAKIWTKKETGPFTVTEFSIKGQVVEIQSVKLLADCQTSVTFCCAQL